MVSPYDIEDIFPNDPANTGLPRQQAGSTAQNLAVTLVADYTLRTRAWLPSASIVALLREAGFGSGAARTAISRLSRSRILESARDGRHSSYRLTTAAATDLSAGGVWIARFATRVEPWDGYWTLVSFSFPQDERGRRRALRGELRWLGFAPLYDALWVSPAAPNLVVEQRLTTTTAGTMTMFRARQVDLAAPAGRNPVDAWDLAAIATRYDTFIRHWEPMLPRIRAGQVSGAAAVHARTEIMDAYRQFPVVDPELPIELLPAGWPRARAREVFVTVYDELAAPAQDHVRTLVTRFSNAPCHEIRAHSTAEMADAEDVR